MATTVKREAVLLRPEVKTVVEQLADDAGISKSKLLSMLVEEALINRGHWQPTTAPRVMDLIEAKYGPPKERITRTPDLPAPLPQTAPINHDDDELMEQFAEFQKFKKLMLASKQQ